MRHLRKFNHLGRTSSHRKAMLANMASSLIIHKRITTTLAKAKALRSYIEPLITRSKEDSTHSRRMVFKYLQSKGAVSELFREIAQKVADRPGGYTRILKTGTRLGDNAEMCMIELVDYNENLLAGQEEKKAKSSRRRRAAGKKKKETIGVTEVNDVTKVEEEVEVVEEAAKVEEEVEVVEEEAEAVKEVEVMEEKAEVVDMPLQDIEAVDSPEAEVKAGEKIEDVSEKEVEGDEVKDESEDKESAKE